MAGKIGTDRFYKSFGTSLSDEQINIPFDGGDIFYSKIENSDSPDYYLIRSYRFGGASCYQEAINVSSFTKHVRVTRNDGVTWTEWVKV